MSFVSDWEKIHEPPYSDKELRELAEHLNLVELSNEQKDAMKHAALHYTLNHEEEDPGSCLKPGELRKLLLRIQKNAHLLRKDLDFMDVRAWRHLPIIPDLRQLLDLLGEQLVPALADIPARGASPRFST